MSIAETHNLANEPDAATAIDPAQIFFAEIANVLERSASTESLFDRLVQSAAKNLDGAATCAWLYEPSTKLLHPAGRTGCVLPFDGLNEPVPVGKTVVGEVAANRLPLVVNDLSKTGDAEVVAWAAAESIRSFVCLPIETDETLIGAFAIFCRSTLSDSTLLAVRTALKLIATEISRRHANVDVKRSYEFLQSMARAVPVAIVGLDRHQNVTFWNQEAEQLFGWTSSDVVGRKYTIVPPDARGSFDEHLRQALAGHRMKRIETVRQHADGRLIPVQSGISPSFNENGEISGTLEIIADASRQARAERYLRTQLAVSSLLATTDSLVEIAPAVLRVVCENLGWTCGEFWLRDLGKNEFERKGFSARHDAQLARFQSTLLANEASPGQGIVGRVISAGGALRLDLAQLPDSPRAALAQRDGLLFAIGTPIVRNGEQQGVLCFFSDHISELDSGLRELMVNLSDLFAQCLERQHTRAALKVAEVNLRQSQKMDAIGLLAGGVAHDFNNILSVILAYSEMGLDELDDSHPLRESFIEINGAGQRAASLTRQLLAFSRKQVFQPVEVDFNKLCEDMDKMLRRLVGANITCESNLTRPIYRVLADPAQLEQVLLNLVVNARDAMPGGGSIRITTGNAELDARSIPVNVQASPGSYVLLSVTDTGCGMDEATKNRIFEPFFTTKEPGKGTGMGLSTVYGIVQQSGGFITVDSAVGKGTTFSVFLPRAKETLATRKFDSSPNELPAGTGTVLIVDSDDSLRTVAARILKLRGYTPIEARNGNEACEILTKQKKGIDLVLTEVLMPGMGGIALARRVEKEFSNAKLLFMSGSADLANDAEQQLVEKHGYLQKPFTSDDLVRKIHSMLSR